MSFEEFKSEEDFKTNNGYLVDEVWYPRITRIVGIKAKPALYRYYAAAPSFAVAKSQTDKSAEEGTLVHNVAEKILIGETPAIPESIRPSIEAFQKFINDNEVLVLPEHVEMRVVHPQHRYAGTLDALAVINGKFGILDIKTSQAIYRDYSLQTSAYLAAVKEQPDLDLAETRWILRVDQAQTCYRCASSRRVKGGREKIRRNHLLPCPPDAHDWGPVQGITEFEEFSGFEKDFEGFLGAKKLWEWENQSWLERVGYLN